VDRHLDIHNGDTLHLEAQKVEGGGEVVAAVGILANNDHHKDIPKEVDNGAGEEEKDHIHPKSDHHGHADDGGVEEDDDGVVEVDVHVHSVYLCDDRHDDDGEADRLLGGVLHQKTGDNPFDRISEDCFYDL